MVKGSKLICFVASTKPDAAKTFYGEILGLELIEDGPFALVFDANGTMLRVQKVKALSPAGYTAAGWDVADIRKAIEQLSAKGVRFERYEGLPQDACGIWTTPDGSQVAWFNDPDGSILSLTQFKK